MTLPVVVALPSFHLYNPVFADFLLAHETPRGRRWCDLVFKSALHQCDPSSCFLRVWPRSKSLLLVTFRVCERLRSWSSMKLEKEKCVAPRMSSHSVTQVSGYNIFSFSLYTYLWDYDSVPLVTSQSVDSQNVSKHTFFCKTEQAERSRRKRWLLSSNCWQNRDILWLDSTDEVNVAECGDLKMTFSLVVYIETLKTAGRESQMVSPMQSPIHTPPLLSLDSCLASRFKDFPYFSSINAHNETVSVSLWNRPWLHLHCLGKPELRRNRAFDVSACEVLLLMEPHRIVSAANV